MSTKTSTVPQEKEPVPSFIKALSFIQNDAEEEIMNDTFSNISVGPIVKSKSENIVEDEETSPMMVVESFCGDQSVKTSTKDLSFGKK